MIDANTIKSLLKGVDVKWMYLKNVSEIGTGSSNRQDENENGIYPFYVRSKNVLRATNYEFDEKAIIIPGEGGIGEIFHYIDGKYALHQRAYRISPILKELNTKFLFYYMSEAFKKYILSKSVGATSVSIRKPMLEKFSIPLIPLDIQNKIVNILDTFTALTTELTTELNTRLKQYNYYRDKLLSFAEDEIEHKKLGEILVRTKGTKITANEMKKIHKDKAEVKIFAGGKTFAFVDYEDIPLKNINKEPSIIVKSRGIIEFEFYDKPFSHKNEMWSYHSKNKNINIKYIYYYLKNKEKFFQQIGSKMQMPQISISDTDGFVIPIPPLSKQKQIVEILDKFDTLANSIAEGLPREIELRQKQYEYYRNLLLDFPKS
ncbi:restriction endonuclease subunit S [Gilliamella apicola]|uniref:Restriction endonuclease subunit S n=7 Tax=Gilliamella apicola TaxID=1196095 RepID=A0A242NLQ1_9GAMM|nr:restriction endonuclease subunit S [Gilliamella apicola]OTP83684.1 restriction endonuclease subunit S [Gilliamella apicola]OTQ01343.1 restriction endonuclease subunit S [Gilliamella apicola]OTQ16020.1 restriction endonuclease subunit S [Gilliamella apicola]